jgi:hypothetical protein
LKLEVLYSIIFQIYVPSANVRRSLIGTILCSFDSFASLPQLAFSAPSTTYQCPAFWPLKEYTYPRTGAVLVCHAYDVCARGIVCHCSADLRYILKLAASCCKQSSISVERNSKTMRISPSNITLLNTFCKYSTRISDSECRSVATSEL